MSAGKRAAIGIYGMVPIEILKDPIAGNHIKVYAAVASFCGGGGWSMSYEQIAERANINRRNAIIGVKALIEAGWIGMHKKAHGLRNEYCTLYPIIETEEVTEIPEQMDSDASDTPTVSDTVLDGVVDDTRRCRTRHQVVTPTTPVLDHIKNIESTSLAAADTDEEAGEDFTLIGHSQLLARVNEELGLDISGFGFQTLLQALIASPDAGKLATFEYIAATYEGMKRDKKYPEAKKEGYLLSLLKAPDVQKRYLDSLGRQVVNALPEIDLPEKHCPICHSDMNLLGNCENKNCGYGERLEPFLPGILEDMKSTAPSVAINLAIEKYHKVSEPLWAKVNEAFGLPVKPAIQVSA
jgi:hypothetical protein